MVTTAATAATATTATSNLRLKGAQNRRMRRRDIICSELPNGSPQCCLKCKAMTGTPEGLSALLSDGGYKHFKLVRNPKTAALGCALCKVIWEVTEHEDRITMTTDRSPATKSGSSLMLLICRTPAEGGLLRHPLTDIQLHSLEVQIPVDKMRRLYSEGEVFYLVTFEGKLTS